MLEDVSYCGFAFIDKDGRSKKVPFEVMDYHFMYNLNCLVKGKVDLCEIQYPEVRLLDDSKEYVANMKSIAKEATRKGVRLVNIIDGKEEFYIAFIEDSVLLNIALYKYVLEVQNVGHLDKDGSLTYLEYIQGVLYKYPPEDIRGYYLRNWLLYQVPEPLNAPEDPDEYYDLLLEKTDLTDFDKYYQNIVKTGTEIMKKIIKDRLFEKYAKNLKTEKYEYRKVAFESE